MARSALSAFTVPLTSFVLIGATASVAIDKGIARADLQFSMEGPSQLTVDVIDHAYWLVRESGVMGTTRKSWRQVTTPVGGINWTLSNCEKTDDGWTLTFWDAASAKLKDRDGPWKRARDKFTRAQAAQAACRDVGVEFAEEPDTDVKQPIEKFTKAEQQQINDAKSSAAAQAITRQQISRGSLNGKAITIKGAKATREQLRNLEIILSVAEATAAPLKAQQAMIVAAIGESGVTAVPNSTGSVYGGVFQGKYRADANGPALFDIGDTAGMAESFLKGGKGFQQGGAIALSKAHPEYSPGGIAIRVEGGVSNFGGDLVAGAAFYDQHLREANKILKARTGQDPTTGGDLEALTGTPDQVRYKRYEFRIDRNESLFQGIARWAQEVRWRFFVVAVPEHPDGIVFFVSDPTLAKADPSMIASEDGAGIDRIRWAVTRRGQVDQVTVMCRLADWGAQQGQVVVINGEGVLVDGRWLVRQIDRDLLDSSGLATITLGQPQKPKKEPAPDLNIISGSDPNVDPSTFEGRKATVAKAYAFCVQVDKQHQLYSYGGGHATIGHATGGSNGDGYDCSGFVSGALNAGGLGVDAPLDTVALGQWGKPGRGKYLTVWVRPLPGATGHTWLQFEEGFTGHGIEIFEAGGTHGAPTGRRTTHGTDGYEPRHYPGT